MRRLFGSVVVIAALGLSPSTGGAAHSSNGGALQARVWTVPGRAPAGPTPTPEATAPPIVYGDVNCTWVRAITNPRTSPGAHRAQCDPVVEQLTHARDFVQGLVGSPLTHGIELILLDAPINAAARVPAQSTAVQPGSVGCYDPRLFDPDPPCSGIPPTGTFGTSAWRCQIQISGDFSGTDGPIRRSALAHELFHCQQREWATSATIDSFFRATPWLIEGSAAWVGEVFANGSLISGAWWNQEYQGSAAARGAEDRCPGGDGDGPVSACIFGRRRGYSAHSFFFALAQERSDAAVVAAVRTAVTGGGGDASMSGIADPSDPVWAHWAAYTRHWPAGGAHWDLRVPGNVEHRRREWHRSLSIRSGPQVEVEAAPTQNKIADVTWSEVRTGEQNMVIDLTGNAVMRWVSDDDQPVGSEQVLNGGSQRFTVCITAPRCRSGTPEPPRGATSVVIAIAGNGSSTSSARVAVECPERNASGVSHISALDGTPGGVSRCCLVGSWRMSQAPEYVNFQTISGGTGAVLTIESDGHLTEDFSGMTEWVVERAGSPDEGRVHMLLGGQLSADIDLDKLVNQRRVKSLATEAAGVLVTASVEIPGSSERLDFGTQPFSEWLSLVVAIAGEPPDENPVGLTCSATTLRLTDSTSGITHEFTRISEPVCGGGACDVRRGEA